MAEERHHPMGVMETSRKRSAEDTGHERDDADRGGAQPDRGSMADDSMHEAMRDAGALGVDAVALAETYSAAGFQRRAGAFGLSAVVAMEDRSFVCLQGRVIVRIISQFDTGERIASVIETHTSFATSAHSASSYWLY